MKKISLQDLRRWKNYHKKNFEYLVDDSVKKLSRTEKRFLVRVKKTLNKQGIFYSTEELVDIWINIKRIIQSNLRKGHVKIDFLNLLLYWSKKTDHSLRLQGQAIGKFREWCRVVEDICAENPKKIGEFKERLKKWIEL